MCADKQYSVNFLNQLYSNRKLENKIAIVDCCGKRKTNFPDLIKCINSYAYYLKSNNINKGDVVAIELPLCMEHYAWRYACSFIGAVFVSINPSLPDKRKEAIKNLSRAKLTIDENLLQVVSIDDYECQIDKTINDDDLGYIVFTSGTTNEPKGILHNRSVFELYYHIDKDWFKHLRKDTFENHECVYGALADPTFVLSVIDMMFVIFGETIHIIDHRKFSSLDKLKNYYIDNKINITIGLPSLINLLLPNDNLKVAVLAGEINVYDFSKYSTIIVNAYGASECPIITLDQIDKDTFISNAFDNAQLMIDKDDGEILFTGPGLMVKYINDNNLTNDVLIYDSTVDKKVYHTHDLVKKVGDGKYQIIGRKDFVVKVLGKRINLLEIENSIKDLDLIKNVVVKVSSSNDNLIEAYYQTFDDNKINENDIKSYLSELLPKYMIPNRFIHMLDFPYNSNGKIDRRSLHADASNVDTHLEDPRNDTEKTIYDIVSGVLLNDKNEKIGVTTNLLEYGLNSLACMEINSKLSSNNMFLPLGFMMFNPNIRMWSEKILSEFEADKKEIEKVKSITDGMDSFPITDTAIFFYDIITKHRFIMKHVKIFNLAAIIQFTNIDQKLLVDSILKLFDIHEGLKSKIIVKDNVPYLLKRKDWKPEINIRSIDAKPDYKFFSKNTKPFDIFKDDLIRINIFKHNQDYYVLFDVHHIITDGFSQQLLIEDLLKLITKEEVKKEIATTYDVSMLFQEYLKSPTYKIDCDYYEKLQSGIKMLKYPRSGFHIKPYFSHVRFLFNEFDEKLIFSYCIKNHVSAPIFFISVLAKALIEILDEDNFEIVSLYHSRDKYYEQNTFSCMFNAFPVVIRNLQSCDFKNVLENLKQQINESYKHKLLFKDSRSLIDEHDVMINYLYDYEKNDEIEQELNNGVKYKQIILNSKKMTQRASTPLTVNVTGGFKKGVIQFGAKYNQSKFSYADMKILVDKLKDIIDKETKK